MVIRRAGTGSSLRDGAIYVSPPISTSSSGIFITQFGLQGDRPVAGAYVPQGRHTNKPQMTRTPGLID